MGLFTSYKSRLPDTAAALPGRSQPLSVDGTHTVLGTPTVGPWPTTLHTAVFGMGCFWGIERLFWRLGGVYSTAAGYAGGLTPNPTYREVCSGRTGHTEVVLIVFDPAKISYPELLVAFWENHDPTQGMRQHHDRGTQYRSAIYTSSPEQQAAAIASRTTYQTELAAGRRGTITTEIRSLAPDAADPGAADPDVPVAGVQFFYAEDYHQQYLDKNPGGYCDMHGTGVSCSIAAPDRPVPA